MNHSNLIIYIFEMIGTVAFALLRGVGRYP